MFTPKRDLLVGMWIIVRTILMFVASVVCIENTGDLDIQPFSFPSEVVKGQSVTLTCAVRSGTGAFAFKWTKDGQPLSDLPLVRIQTFDEYSVLSLKSVDHSRIGNYTCQVMNSISAANHTAELVVYEPPEWIALPKDVEVILGNDTKIDCSVSGIPEPTIEWKKIEKSQFSRPINRGRHQILSNGTLFLRKVGTEDAGDYECNATNGIGKNLHKVVSVVVRVPPQFHETYQLIKVRSTHSAVLRCEVSGDAPITLKWSKEYFTDEKDRFKIQETPLPNGIISELYISRVMRQDAGLYVCQATNNYGKQQKSIKLVVLEPPASPSEIAIKQIDRDQATVEWATPYSGNSPIVRYVVQYWKDTGAPPKLEEVSVGSDKTSCILGSLRPGMSYVVRVIAENEFGSSTPSVPVRFYTEEDKPSGYPTDLTVFPRGPHDLIVRWKAPAPDQRNGIIQGYELGYREQYSLEPYVYREAPRSASLSQEFVVDKLQENTNYEIVVRAYNRAGKGPTSIPVVAKTREKGTLVAPMLWMDSSSASTILLRWSGNENAKSSTLRHTLFYKTEGGHWNEKTLPNSTSRNYLLTGLEENTLYYLYIQAFSGDVRSNPSTIISARTAVDPSFERSSMTQVKEVSYHTTLVISLSVVISCVIIVCVVAGACIYVTRVTMVRNDKREGPPINEFLENPSTSRSTPLSRHASNFRYVDVNSRPLLWCSTPAPPNDYPSPYATLPLRHTPMSKHWPSNEGLSPAASERSESLINQRVEIPDEKSSSARE